ncbi:VOC family protein [Lederbergia wuyishanensis]|uniref:Lactoylglutathione lyase n=1 Tax=Lederbergia wuyishanensis TaxID=1347903 RepID=A0ABU0D5U0_9BACI|nr:VOC family protein [Lederbergia wuyishanensis]MCJ8008309.1 VOC family protein [Lederbergia wuyishanensis]MDQ0343721.1 putative lactoylglutathione lyase [Lederbergia wuyishanensis]
MTKQFWINLPVNDVAKSKEFFTKLGFTCSTKHGGFAELTIGDNNVQVMLFPESTFMNFTSNEIIDTKKSTEVLFSIDAESREEVDNMAKTAEDAGGTIFGKPGESQGWMYGCVFADLDGHRWNVLYMDMDKMPKA